MGVWQAIYKTSNDLSLSDVRGGGDGGGGGGGGGGERDRSDGW